MQIPLRKRLLAERRASRCKSGLRSCAASDKPPLLLLLKQQQLLLPADLRTALRLTPHQKRPRGKGKGNGNGSPADPSPPLLRVPPPALGGGWGPLLAAQPLTPPTAPAAAVRRQRVARHWRARRAQGLPVGSCGEGTLGAGVLMQRSSMLPRPAQVAQARHQLGGRPSGDSPTTATTAGGRARAARLLLLQRRARARRA